MFNTILVLSKSNFAYRSKIVINYVQIAVALLVKIAIWKAISKSGNIEMTSKEIISYFIIIRICLLFRNDIDGEVRQEVKSGTIIYRLIRPLSLIKNYFVTTTPKTIVNVLMYGVLLFVILLFQMRPTILNFVIFIIFMIMTYVFMILYNIIFAAIIMLVKNGDALYWGNVFLIMICSGALIPINLLSENLKFIEYLPFKYIGYYPTSILLGNVELGSAMQNIAIFLIWIILTLVFAIVVEKVVLKNITIQGG